MGKIDFIVIGTLNGCMRKYVFPHFVDGTIFLGLESPKTFISRKGSEKKFGNIKWFTTFDMPRSPLPPESYKCPCEYERFVNSPGINVNRLSDIPKDYYGVVGVPITFLEHDYGDWTILDINNVPILEGGGIHSNACSYREIFSRILIKRNEKI